MSDILQFHDSSANVKPGKGNGETAADLSRYSELSKITNWRRSLSKKENLDTILPLTQDAQLWNSGPNGRGPKQRATDLEERRRELVVPEELQQNSEAHVDSAAEQQNSEAQRNVSVATEMDSPAPAPVPAEEKQTKSKKTPKSKKNVEPTPVTQTTEIPTSTLGGVPEGAIASVAPRQTTASASTETDGPAETSESSLRYCPVCENYLYMKVDGEDQQLWRDCRKCGFREKDNKGGLVMEMMIQERSAEGYKILLNEFTRKDPRLPHIRKNITCPNVACDSNRGGHDPDVIYIKYDVVNLMYLYICDICGEQWHSRSRN